jgi:hypothetical protein
MADTAGPRRHSAKARHFQEENENGSQQAIAKNLTMRSTGNSQIFINAVNRQ